MTDAATGVVTVTLTAGETVTCTYTNRPLGLVLRKITLGGIGAFDFDVKGQERSESVTATTIAPGLPVDAVPAERIQSLPAGGYEITEHLPDSDGGPGRSPPISAVRRAAGCRGRSSPCR